MKKSRPKAAENLHRASRFFKRERDTFQCVSHIFQGGEGAFLPASAAKIGDFFEKCNFFGGSGEIGGIGKSGEIGEIGESGESGEIGGIGKSGGIGGIGGIGEWRMNTP